MRTLSQIKTAALLSGGRVWRNAPHILFRSLACWRAHAVALFNGRRMRSWFQRSDEGVGLQPFELVKYFAFASLIVLFFASIILSWAISNNARRVLLARSESYSLLVAKNLNQQVFIQFVLPTVVRYGQIALSNSQQFERLDTIIRNLTSGLDVQTVTIYDSRENIVSYSTRRELVGKRNLGGLEYQKALTGTGNSSLDSSGSLFRLFPWNGEATSHLRTFIPFRQNQQDADEEGGIMGVIEVEKDLSGDLAAIVSLQIRIIVLSFTVMGVLFGVLSMIVIRANRVIEQRVRERRQLIEKLHEAERLASLGKMVAAVSHEIKNPLGIVRSTAEILGKRIGKVAPGNEHLASIIVEETARLDSIVRRFLDFARPQTPSLKPVAPDGLIGRLRRFIQPELDKHKVSLEVDVAAELPEVAMDSEQIYQALLNLVFNGIQAMDGGGILTISAALNGQELILAVADTGGGMEPGKLEQIFTPFFTDKDKGTGLGLAIARSIVEKHQGRITVESSPGKGTVFRVILPVES